MFLMNQEVSQDSRVSQESRGFSGFLMFLMNQEVSQDPRVSQDSRGFSGF